MDRNQQHDAKRRAADLELQGALGQRKEKEETAAGFAGIGGDAVCVEHHRCYEHDGFAHERALVDLELDASNRRMTKPRHYAVQLANKHLSLKARLAVFKELRGKRRQFRACQIQSPRTSTNAFRSMSSTNSILVRLKQPMDWAMGCGCA